MVDGTGSAQHALIGGRYELQGLLGRGGMADVFRAVDRVTGAQVAVKVFRPGIELTDSERRLRREVDLLASLRHPGLVRVLDADVGDDAIAGHTAYLVMELVDGPTLRDRVREQPLVPADVAALGAALCSALGYVHERGVVHRDVKPANVLLAATDDPAGAGTGTGTGTGMPKLTDFGIAQVVDSTRLTTDGLTVGTANYLSPEQARGDRVGPASDVYSLGLVLLEAVTGEVAYPGHGIEAALARLHRPPAIPTGLPPRLGALLARMTARDPQHRPTAADAGAELARAADPSLASELLALDAMPAGDDATTLLTAGQHRRVPARRRGGLLTAGAVSVGVLAVLGAYLSRGNPVSDGSPSVRSGQTSSAPRVSAASPTARSSARPAPTAAATSSTRARATVAAARTTAPGAASSHGPATRAVTVRTPARPSTAAHPLPTKHGPAAGHKTPPGKHHTPKKPPKH